MDLICDFSIGFDNDVEDVSFYNDDFTEEQITEFLEKIVRDKLITVGERCEGTISVSHDTINIESRWCSDLGEDWHDDSWEDEEVNLPRNEYEI